MPLRILLIDDDQAVRSLTAEMLTDLGHNVTAVENGPAAIALLSTATQSDLLLVDFAMPVMNGAEVAAQAIKLRPQLPILFMTGFADTGILNSWTGLGYHTINKPFSAAELDQAMRQTMTPRPQTGNIVPLTHNRSERA
jgi:CheY-like chemotaxis protein